MGVSEAVRPGSDARENHSALFPIVGIAASARGFSAARELLLHLGTDPGVAVVLVQEFGSAHERNLASLSEVTAMTVQVVSTPLELEVNHVYVAPPNAGLVLAASTARPTLHVAVEPTLNIVSFFESLAGQQSNHAIGVLSSDLEVDGGRGLASVRRAGGITFALVDCRLVESAAAAKTVTVVFTPPAVAEKIRAIADQRALAASADEGPLQVPRGSLPAMSDVIEEADRLVLAAFGPAGVIINEEFEIVQFRGAVGPYLEAPVGPASLEFVRMLPEDVRIPLRLAVEQARETQKAATCQGRTARLTVIPLGGFLERRRFFVVLFQPTVSQRGNALGAQPSPPDSGPDHLGRELAATQNYLRSVIEQFEGRNEALLAANEEVACSNEELRSTNEELRTTQEELETSNEALRALNDEMILRNAESRRLSDDLCNVLSSAGIPILILDRASRVRRFTAAAAKLFRLVSTDVGRPIGNIQPAIRVPELPQILAHVLQHLDPVERMVQDDEGRWHQLVVRPYVTTDNRVDGTTLVGFDIDALKKAQQELHDSQERIQQLAFERVVAEERERRRIASDLHDRIGQSLALTQIKLTGLRGELSGAQRAAVDDAVKLLAQSVLDTRTLTFELSPPILYDLGLKDALAWLAEQLEREHGVRVEVSDDGANAPLDDATAALVFRAVRELLVNVVKHAQSASATVALGRSGDQFEVRVEDAGVGFDSEPGPAAVRGYGLYSVREQIGRLGGSLVISSAPQAGTRVKLRIPLRRSAEVSGCSEAAQ